MRLLSLVICLAVAGCASDLPRTPRSAAMDAPYPKLEPLDQLLASAEAGSSVVEDAQTLAARVAGLKSRAAALKGRSVFDGASRLKLINAGARNRARLGG